MGSVTGSVMGSVESGTVGKALGVLELVAAQDGPVRFTELQRQSPLPKATLYRLLQTLVIEGMLAQEPDTGAYAMGLRLVRLAHAAWRQASLAPVARPHVAALAAQTGYTVHLAQLDYGHVLYVDRRRGRDTGTTYSDAGKIAPAYCTAAGKAMLAWLDPQQLELVLGLQSFQRFTPTTLASATVLREALTRVRERGHATDREEYQLGVVCVAVPILSAENRMLGALSLSGPAGPAALKELEAWVPQLRDSAEAIAVDMTQSAFPVA